MTNFRKTSAKRNLKSVKRQIRIVESRINRLKQISNNLLNLPQTAEIMGKSRDTITRWCKEEKLMCREVKFGTKVTHEIFKKAVHIYLTEELEALEAKLLFYLPTKTKGTDLSQHVEEFKDVCLNGMHPTHRRAYSQNTVDLYERVLKDFFAKHDEIDDPDVFEAYIASIPVKQNSKRRRAYEALVCYLKYLIHKGLVNEEVLTELPDKDEKKESKKDRIVYRDQVEDMLDVTDNPQHRTILIVLFGSALRASELANIKYRDINLEKGYIRVVGKGDKRRVVPIVQSVYTALYEYFQDRVFKPSDYIFEKRGGGPLDRHGVRHIVYKAADKAGIKACPHAFRHGFITERLMDGESPSLVQDISGHTDIRVTYGYKVSNQEKLIEATRNWR